jgi:hypothetical protein
MLVFNEVFKESRGCFFIMLISRVRHSSTVCYEFFCVRGDGNKTYRMCHYCNNVVR